MIYIVPYSLPPSIAQHIVTVPSPQSTSTAFHIPEAFASLAQLLQINSGLNFALTQTSLGTVSTTTSVAVFGDSTALKNDNGSTKEESVVDGVAMVAKLQNSYDVRLFHEIATTLTLSVWPVGYDDVT
jgi:hypothetical protein